MLASVHKIALFIQIVGIYIYINTRTNIFRVYTSAHSFVISDMSFVFQNSTAPNQFSAQFATATTYIHEMDLAVQIVKKSSPSATAVT